MLIRQFTYHFLLVFIFVSAYICSAAQKVEIKTDRNGILIGERIEYDLFITLPSQGYSINFGMPDSLPHFETIEANDYDTISENAAFILRKKFVFTGFDSGAWYIPAIPVTLAINGDKKLFTTDSVLINVSYSVTDTTIDLRDIKPIMEIQSTNYITYILAGALLFISLLIFLIYLHLKRKAQKPLPVMYSALSPFDEAINDLKNFGKYDLTIASEIKQYHSQLGFILKRYYSRISDSNLLNKTTGEFLLLMKQQEAESNLVTTVAQNLRTGDAVKFARHIPSIPDSENCFACIKQVIEKIEKNKPNKIQH